MANLSTALHIMPLVVLAFKEVFFDISSLAIFYTGKNLKEFTFENPD
jgi:hypothetical protein